MTVEAVVAELHDLYGRRRIASFKVQQCEVARQDGVVKSSAMIALTSHSKYFYGATLADCMAQVRAWAASAK